MPISDELHDLVGNPVPSGDLGRRARDRAGEIKRRRMAGLVTSVVAVSVLAVPGAFLVREQSGSVNGSPGSGSAQPSPAATSASAVFAPDVTKVVPQTQDWDAVDSARFARALTLLGEGFTRTGVGVVIDTQTGKQVGTSATFTTTDGGGTVGVQWTEVAGYATWIKPPTLTSVGPAPSGAFPSGAVSAMAGAVAAPSGTVVLDQHGAPGGTAGGVSSAVSENGKLQVSVMVVQGKGGSPEILPGKAASAFANDLLKAAG